jgi:hypothetical protein
LRSPKTSQLSTDAGVDARLQVRAQAGQAGAVADQDQRAARRCRRGGSAHARARAGRSSASHAASPRGTASPMPRRVPSITRLRCRRTSSSMRPSAGTEAIEYSRGSAGSPARRPAPGRPLPSPARRRRGARAMRYSGAPALPGLSRRALDDAPVAIGRRFPVGRVAGAGQVAELVLPGRDGLGVAAVDVDALEQGRGAARRAASRRARGRSRNSSCSCCRPAPARRSAAATGRRRRPSSRRRSARRCRANRLRHRCWR